METPPGPGQLVPTEGFDYSDCREAFGGAPWASIPHETIMSNRQCVYFLTDEAIHYYLPAFVVASLREVRDLPHGWDITGDTLQAITWISREFSWVRLSSDQRTALGHYLSHLSSVSEAATAKAAVDGCAKALAEAPAETTPP